MSCFSSYIHILTVFDAALCYYAFNVRLALLELGQLNYIYVIRDALRMFLTDYHYQNLLHYQILALYKICFPHIKIE